MKNILFAITLIFIASFASAQTAQSVGEIVSRTSTVVPVPGDTTYLLRIQTVTDLGNAFPDTSVSYTFLGDSLAAINYFLKLAEDLQVYTHAGVNRAFELPQIRQDRSAINDNLTTITGGDNLNDLNFTRYAAHYGAYPASNDTLTGQYQLFFSDNTNSFARMIKLAGGGWRLRKTTSRGGGDVSPVNSNQYVVVPTSPKSFQITYPQGGTVYSFWLDENVRNPNFEVFRPLQFIPGLNGTPVIRIRKYKTVVLP